MYCCNLLKLNLSVTLQDKFLGMGIFHPHHSQLQASTRTWATWAARRKMQLHTWKTSPSVCAWTALQPPSWSKPFIHLPATNSCQEASIPVAVQTTGLPWWQGSAKQSPSACSGRSLQFSLSHLSEPAETEINRKRETLETCIPCLPGKHPPSHSTSNLDSPSEVFILKWQVLSAEWNLNLYIECTDWRLCFPIWVKGAFFLWGHTEPCISPSQGSSLHLQLAGTAHTDRFPFSPSSRVLTQFSCSFWAGVPQGNTGMGRLNKGQCEPK